jgi:hypothetical protein
MLPIAPTTPTKAPLPTSRSSEAILSGAFWASASAALALAFTPDQAPAQYSPQGDLISLPRKSLTPALVTGVIAGVAGACATALLYGRKAAKAE